MALKLKKKQTTVKKIIKKSPGVAKPVLSANTQASASTVALPTGEYIQGVGRRKVASATVRLYKAGGDFVVNGVIAGQYFATVPQAHVLYNEPFEVTGTRGTYGVNVHVSGSGTSSQLDAVRLGIARALIKIDPEYRVLLKQKGLLTRDDRMKETRKIGMGGKARRSRQSPKR